MCVHGLPAMRVPVQLMAIGGNARARHFFKQHGWDELGADKIESKVGRNNCSTVGTVIAGRSRRG